ncbi:phage terminase large subunit [Glutamicibacter ardleyensis]|uniref:phage terminase large subunit n=1 Tax=Glutamicibacter ardleyensis TaxID=225894 RepID=UPI003FD2B899
MTAPAVKVWQYPFKPYEKQRQALTSPADEVLFGGSLGGGKSEVLLAACVTVCTLVPGAKALLVRRSYSELSELVKRLRERLPSEIAKYNKSDHVFYFANGAELHLGYLERPEHATRYQGHEFVLVAFDELTHYDKESYVLLMSRLRATGPVAERMKQLRLPLRTLSASNPGSKGHGWVKAHFIDPAPHRTLFTDEESGARRIFIPSSLYDNPYLDHAEYLKKLGAMDPDLKRAMVDGDWDIISGTRFNQWRTKHHVISPSQLPIPALTGRKVIAVDYGFSAPFAAVWLCLLHDGLVVQYREEYATELTARQQAQRILELSSEEEAITGQKIPIVMDPAMWRRNDATTRKNINTDLPPVGSPAHDYMKVLDRVPHKGVNARVHGWAQLDEKLLVREDGFARYMVYDTCRDTIRTLPAMPRDKKNPEDVDTHGDDHLLDSIRYGLMFLAGKRVGQKKEQQERKRLSPITGGLRSKDF